MKYLLVTLELDDSYACGMTVCTEEQKDYENSVVQRYTEATFDSALGEFMIYDMPFDVFWEYFTFTEITETTYNELKTALTTQSRSWFGNWFFWPSQLVDEDE